MAWKESHKAESRQRILVAAAELFNRKGFNPVGVDEVMQAAGMTRGAFYAHFSSKIELYEAAILHAGLAAVEHFNENSSTLEDIIDNYLSEDHLAVSRIRCPMSCLVSDVAHDNERVRNIYTRMFRGFNNHLGQIAQDKCNDEVQLLQAILLIGGMAISRSLTDEQLSRKILALCAQAAKNAEVINSSK